MLEVFVICAVFCAVFMDQELLLNAGSPEKIRSLLLSKRGNEILSFVDQMLSKGKSDSTDGLLEMATYGLYPQEEL